MKKPWFMQMSIPASGTAWCDSQIALVKARTLSITIRLTFNASATGNAKAYLYYSPDGKYLDTVAYSSWTITVSAGNTIQQTEIIDPPEHGYLTLKIANEDQTYTITNVKAWYTIQSWELRGAPRRGALREDTGEDVHIAYPDLGLVAKELAEAIKKALLE